MDPNATLKEIRALVAFLISTSDSATSDDPGRVETAALSLAEHVEALDTWITNGGFLPSAWVRS